MKVKWPPARLLRGRGTASELRALLGGQANGAPPAPLFLSRRHVLASSPPYGTRGNPQIHGPPASKNARRAGQPRGVPGRQGPDASGRSAAGYSQAGKFRTLLAQFLNTCRLFLGEENYSGWLNECAERSLALRRRRRKKNQTTPLCFILTDDKIVMGGKQGKKTLLLMRKMRPRKQNCKEKKNLFLNKD